MLIMEFEDFRKMFFCVMEPDGTYSAIVQIGGFVTEEEAQNYLANCFNTDKVDFLSGETRTIH